MTFRSTPLRVPTGLLLLAFVIFLMAPSSLPAATVMEDLVISSVEIREGKTTRIVELEPFQPVAYLESQLPSLPPMNASIVRDILSYPRTGRHTYFWPRKGEGPSYDGCTTDVVLRGQTVLKGEPQGRTFCCGLTLEVAYRALERLPQLPDALTSDSATQFKRLWFCTAIDAPGPEDALKAFGIGRRVSYPERAMPGDFVQLWRHNKSGHSVVFVAWAKDRLGNRVGVHYWSTQPATEGIGFRTELFGNRGSGVKKEAFSVSRLLTPNEWKPLTSEQAIANAKPPVKSVEEQ